MRPRKIKAFKQSIIIQYGDDSIIEYKPNIYGLAKKGVVVSTLSDEELLKESEILINKKNIQVDPGILEVSLALVAVCALLASGLLSLISVMKTEAFVATIIAFVAFLMSSYAAGRLFYTYLICKFPRIYIVVINSHFAHFGLVGYYFLLFFRIIKRYETDRTETEFAYLSLLGAFFLTWIAAFLWITFSLIGTFKSII